MDSFLYDWDLRHERVKHSVNSDLKMHILIKQRTFMNLRHEIQNVNDRCGKSDLVMERFGSDWPFFRVLLSSSMALIRRTSSVSKKRHCIEK